MDIIQEITAKAQNLDKTIVLPESEDERILKAANTIQGKNIANIILIGNEKVVRQDINRLDLKNLSDIGIIDPINHPDKEQYANLFYELRKHKGVSESDALKMVENPLYLGCLLIKDGKADGQVAGAINATGDVIRPALQILKTKKGIKVVSSFFLMVLQDKKFGQDGIMFFADCGLNINPGPEELAEIAITTASSAQSIANIDPKIAMLSFSTKGSAKHEMADKMIEATRKLKERAPELKVDGELQLDAALIDSVANKKAPGSPIEGQANILIFPDLNAGNIGYKLTQRLAGAEAIGPVLQGIAKPVNDLSRGCSVEDIVTSAAITINQAAEED